MKKIAILMAAAVLMTLTAGMVSAETAKIDMMNGEVVSVDAAAGTIVINAHDEDLTLKAEPNLLEGFYPGERVDVEVTGDMLKSIKKVEAPAIK